jgi:hypothetical protein
VVSVLVNLAFTLVLVDSLGAKGAFLASLIPAVCLIVPLAKAGLDSVDASVAVFLRHAVWPAFVVGLPTVAATSTVVLLPLSDLVTVIVGGGVGLVAYLVMMARSLRASGELAELLGVLRPRSTESPVPGPNGSTPELVSR